MVDITFVLTVKCGSCLHPTEYLDNTPTYTGLTSTVYTILYTVRIIILRILLTILYIVLYSVLYTVPYTSKTPKEVLKHGPTRHRPMTNPVVFLYLSYSPTFAEHGVHRLRRCPAFGWAATCLFLSVLKIINQSPESGSHHCHWLITVKLGFSCKIGAA